MLTHELHVWLHACSQLLYIRAYYSEATGGKKYIGIKCIIICWISREELIMGAEGWGFQHFQRDLVNVIALKIMFVCYHFMNKIFTKKKKKKHKTMALHYMAHLILSELAFLSVSSFQGLEAVASWHVD